MTEHTDHSDGHDHAAPDESDGTASEREVTAWHLVPTAPPGTVPVEWTDLNAMRRRIDDLERERERLETRLEQSRERRRRTVERYERLLDRRPGAETTRPRVRADDAETGRWRTADGDGDESESEDEASRPTVAADGGFDGAATPDGKDGGVSGQREGTAGGPVSRLVAALAGLVSRG